MSFTVLAAICLSTTAAAIACLLSMVASKLFLHKSNPGRLTAAAVLFSISIVAATIILLYIANPLDQIKSLLNFDKILYYSIICGVAFLTAILYRFLLPIGLVLYLLYCILFAFFFFNNFDKRNETIELKVTSDTLFYGDTPFSFTSDDTSNHYLVVQTLAISDSLLLTLPKTWFKTVGVTNERDTLPDSLYDVRYTTPYSTINKLLDKIFYLVDKTGSYSYYYIEIPDNSVYPTLYTLQISTKGLSFFYELNRLF